MASLKRRGKNYYAQYYLGGKQKRVSLNTTSLQIAKEKLRQIESALFRDADLPLPTRTPLNKVVAAYCDHLTTVKTFRNAQRDMYYLREVFGPICDQLKVRNQSIRRKRIQITGRKPIPPIEAQTFEQITTAEFADFIARQVRTKKLAPKTANRFREILTRLYNWAMEQYGVRLPNNVNPASKVERYKERAREISFLSHDQIGQQLNCLEEFSTLQTMVAMYIYAGLRRAEVLWLTKNDVDLEAGVIRVCAKTINNEYWQPKTGHNRVVPISSKLRGYLSAYTAPETDEGWFFASPMGKRWEEDNFSSALKKVNKEKEVDWSCLDYRHTFGSHLAMKGESLYKISSLMGNSPDICRKHYAALLPESLVSVVEF